MTVVPTQLLLDAGWKESQTVPGYWVDPENGTLYEPLAAWRITDCRKQVDGNNPEKAAAIFQMHQQSKSWAKRREARGKSVEHTGSDE